MKVALFQPNVPILGTLSPLGVLYLAGVLEKEGFEVFVFDERFDKDTFKKIASFKPDIFGVTAVTPAYLRGLSVSRDVKRLFPSVKVVFGGPHPSALPLSLLKEEAIDYVLIGEGEKAFLALCRAIREGRTACGHLKDIKNVALRNERGIPHLTAREDFLTGKELDELPFPAYHLTDLGAYFKGAEKRGIFQRGSRVLSIMTTRGCPNTCTFCCRVMGGAIRKRSVNNVVSEIGLLIKRYRIDELFIADDNFTADKKRAIELLDMIKGLDIRYLNFPNSVFINAVDEEILEKMKEAGVYYVTFGIESGSESTLKKMSKHLDLKRAKRVILSAKKLGLLVGSNCIMGYPGETPKDIQESRNYFFSLRLDSITFINLVPFPGTRVRRICEEKGYLTQEAKDWSNYYFSLYNPVPLIETPWLSKKDLIKEIRRSYRRMFFNLFWVIKALKNIPLERVWLRIREYIGLGGLRGR